jgi:hypothetical protein
MERAGKFSARRVKCSIAKETPSLGCSPASGYNLAAKAVKGKTKFRRGRVHDVFDCETDF